MTGSWVEYSSAVETPVDTSNITVEYSENAGDIVYSPQYKNAGFFPFDHPNRGGEGWDLGFGVSMEIKFTLGPDGKLEDGTAQKFTFSGDDDLRVYVDDQLVLDLGGDHKKTTGEINFNTLKSTVTSSTAIESGVSRNGDFTLKNQAVHTMKLFYLERGMFDSNLRFTFSMYPYDDTYDVEKVADISGLNEGLKSQYSDYFTFKNTGDSKGANAKYTVYDSKTNTAVASTPEKPNPGTTTTSREFTINNGQYAVFTNIFTVDKPLQTVETPSGIYRYDTTYKVVDSENNNALVKAGYGLDTEQFNFLTTLAGADPELDITHLRTIFTNKLKTESFMVTKEINDYDDAATAFPFKVEIKMTPSGKSPVLFNTKGLVYKSSLENYEVEHTLGEKGLGEIHEGEYILFDGIPEGAKVTVYEPTADTTNRTPNATGNANCYKHVTIANENSTNSPQRNKRNGVDNQYTDITIQLDGFDTITITNEPKVYRMDYILPTRLYGEKVYKLTGYITPAMVAQGYVEINNSEHTAFLTQKFVSEHIPRETIFMKNIIWNSSNTNYEDTKPGFDDYVYLRASSTDKKLTVKVDRDGDNVYETTVSGLYCGQSIKLDGDYITGAKGSPSYWQITTLDGTPVTRCYSSELNYVAYENYLAKAVYGQGSAGSLYDDAVSANVNNLGITRSHWNDTVSGVVDPATYYDEYDKTDKAYNYYHEDTEYDRLYLDMELAFEAEGKMINTYGTDVVNVGYEICILNEDNATVKKVYKTVNLDNTKLNNKNRIHAYYGFANNENNRDLKLGIRAFTVYNGSTVYSDIMTFELNTEGSKGLSSEYDTTTP